MKPLRLLAPLLVLAIALPVGSAVAESDSPTAAVAAKKKKKKATYCDKKSKAYAKKTSRSYNAKTTLKRIGHVKSSGFSVYRVNIAKARSLDLFLCNEKPKIATTTDVWDGFKKISHVGSVKNKCSFFIVAQKGGETRAVTVDHSILSKGKRKNWIPSFYRLAEKGETLKLHKVVFTKNCMVAATFTRAGKQKIFFDGISQKHFGNSYISEEIPGWSLAEMKSVKITDTSSKSAVVSWTRNGETRSYPYPNPTGYYTPSTFR